MLTVTIHCSLWHWPQLHHRMLMVPSHCSLPHWSQLYHRMLTVPIHCSLPHWSQLYHRMLTVPIHCGLWHWPQLCQRMLLVAAFSTGPSFIRMLFLLFPWPCSHVLWFPLSLAAWGASRSLFLESNIIIYTPLCPKQAFNVVCESSINLQNTNTRKKLPHKYCLSH